MKTKYCTGGGVAIFVQESICYTKRNDLCINCEAIESHSIEIINNDVKNIVYRPPDKRFRRFAKTIFRAFFQIIQYNINVLDFEQNKKVQILLI